jgi:DNA-binding transcriptional MerR regulator
MRESAIVSAKYRQEIPMKPQQLAKLLNIADSTLRLWAGKDFTEFLSPKAQGPNGARRSFSAQDARILAWIAQMRAQNMPIGEIRGILKSAQVDDWRNLPPLPGGMANDEPIAVIPLDTAEERIRSIQQRYDMQLQSVIKERDDLKSQLEVVRREIETVRREAAESAKNVQEQSSDTVKTLQQRITELTEREAELRGMMAQYTFAGRRLNAATMVVIALLAGVVLALVIVVLFAGR